MPLFNVNTGGGVNTKDATAIAVDILTGKTAYVNKQKVVGTMNNLKNTTLASVFSYGGTNYVVGKLSNYSNGSIGSNTLVNVPVSNLAASNIKQGVNVGGVVGSYAGDFHGGSGNTSVGSQTITFYHGLGKIPTMFIASQTTDDDFGKKVRLMTWARLNNIDDYNVKTSTASLNSIINVTSSYISFDITSYSSSKYYFNSTYQFVCR